VLHLKEPIGLILAMVLHFFEAEPAREIMTTFAEALAPGSYVVMSVGSGDERTGGQLAKKYMAGTLHNHSPAEIASFFTGFDLLQPPGLVDACDWDAHAVEPREHRGGRILAGVARKPGG
jgi:hypothetical protein